MSHATRSIRETTTRMGNAVQRDTEVSDPNVESSHANNVMERVVYLIFGLIESLLAIRFVISMFGANTTNGFANFIYSTTQPLVAPFFNLFNYNNYQYGVARIEIFTIVAMIVYSLLAWLIIRLVNVNRE